jgi:putative ABC transport system ATP-binding protein
MILLTDVTKTYGGRVTALDRVTLHIERNELTAIVGPSGSGKSTMLNIVGALDRPTSGTVRLDGHDIASLSDRQLSALRATRIGFVFQQFHLAAGTSALDNIADGLLYLGMRRSERRRRAAAALERVGLSHRTDHDPHELSGGERQRVAIARAVAGDPPLLLADEPTGALDTKSGEDVKQLLNDLHDDGQTIVLVTHDLALAESCATRMIRLVDGRVVADVRSTTAGRAR